MAALLKLQRWRLPPGWGWPGGSGRPGRHSGHRFPGGKTVLRPVVLCDVLVFVPQPQLRALSWGMSCNRVAGSWGLRGGFPWRALWGPTCLSLAF